MRRVYGIHSVEEVIKTRPRDILSMYIKGDYKKSKKLTNLFQIAKQTRIQVKQISPGFLDKWGEGHQGIGVEVTSSPELNWDELKKKDRSVLVSLDEIEDPRNMGAILRSAWLLGADGMLVPKQRSVKMTPAVAKAASGGAEHVAIEVVGNFAYEFDKIKDAGYWIVGLSGNATKNLWDLEIPPKVLWVLGSEGEGLRKTTEKACDELVKIPQVSPVSYNVSIAGSLALYETARQFSQGQ